MALEDEKQKLMEYRDKMREKLKSAGRNEVERKKQEKLHKQIRKLWRKVREGDERSEPLEASFWFIVLSRSSHSSPSTHSPLLIRRARL